MTPDEPFPLNAEWLEAWAIVRKIGYTGPITVNCTQGAPVEVAFPGKITRIRLTKPVRAPQT